MSRFLLCSWFVFFFLFGGMLIFPTIFAEPLFFFEFGSFGLEDDELNEPNGIALDASGKSIYIVDKNNNRINVFDDDGIDDFNFGSFCNMAANQGCHDNSPKADEDGDGQFNQPSDVVIDAFGDIYVTDSQNNRVQRFDSDGDFEIKFGSSDDNDQDYLGFPVGMAIQKSTRDIHVTDTDTDSISVFDSSGSFLFKFGDAGSSEGEFRNPTSIIIDDSEDILYVADTDNDRIQIFELVDGNTCPQGTDEIVDGVCFVDEFGSIGLDKGEFNSPSGLALDTSNDLLYVADTDNDRIQIFELVDGNTCPQGTDEIVDGVCFVDEFGSTGSDDGEFVSPTGLAIDTSNDLLYVADTDNDRIQVFITLAVTDTIPDAPTNLDATAASPTSIILTWDAPSLGDQAPDITGYKIEYKTGSGNFVTLVADTKNANTHFLHEGLTDETHTYRVYAINSDGTSAASSQSSAKPQTTTVPAGLTATAISPNQIRLSWNPPSETFGQSITDYTIKREIVPGVYEDIATVDDKLTYVVGNLATGKTYTYVVIANYALGSSDVSNTASATPQKDSKDHSSSSSVTIPTSPKQLTAVASSNQIKLSWNIPSSDGNSPITGYKIETKKDGSSFSVLIEDTKSTQTSYTHTSVLPDTTYTYRVSAINSVGTSTPSTETSATLADISLEIKPLGTFKIDEGQTLSFTVSVTDSLDDLKFSLATGAPSGATINSDTGKFTWTPTKSQGPGSYIFDVVVKKGTLEDRQSVTIHVNDIPDPPQEPISKIASFVDPNKDPQHYVDRYNNEPRYKDWFDTNYPDRTIYEAVGIEELEQKPKTEPKQEPPKEPVSKIASFVDPNNDPQYYVDRYNNEESYKEWFDTNFSEYSSIYEAVGLEEPESKKILPFVDPKQDPEYYIDRYNTESSYREWFDENYPDYSIYEAVGLETPMGFCGEGTTLIDGVCEVKQGYVKPKQTCFLFWCW